MCFDTETTGKETDRCGIIELAGVRVRNGREVDTFHSLISTDEPIAPGATQVHGYTDADLVGQPDIAVVWPRFRQFVGNVPLVVHNGLRFDVPVIERLTWHCGGTVGLSFFDTLPLARSLIESGSLKLVDLAASFGIDAGRSHHALDDSRCLAQVFERLLAERTNRTRRTCLSRLLASFAIGAAIENRGDLTPEDRLLAKLGNWQALGKHSTVLDDYETIRLSESVSAPSASELIERMGGIELRDRARQDRSPEDRFPDTYGTLRALINSVQETSLADSIRKLLDTLALSRSDGAGVAPNRVSLLTHHATKGLEFSRVYVIGVEDDERDLQSSDPNTMKEVRRLVYVAMTRAIDRLSFTYCQERNGRPLRGTTLLTQMGLVPD